MLKQSILILICLNISLMAKDAVINIDNWKRPTKIPTPLNNPITKDKIFLGRKLFFDPLLSRAKNISCSSCHNPVKGWSESSKVAIGDKGAKGNRNTPTIINSAYQYSYFFDGRAKSLEEQALGPIEAHVEMNLAPREAVNRVKENEEYQVLFKKAFPTEKINTNTLAKAIASFERTIVSGESRFDKWIAGNKTILSKEEKEGFNIFLHRGNCDICHNRFNFTDESFNNIGIDNADLGRGAIKRNTFWKGTFKTPTLRNIANTSPYFHDGSVAELKEVVKICGEGGKNKKVVNKSQLIVDKNLSEKEINSIVSFLKTLSEPVVDF